MENGTIAVETQLYYIPPFLVCYSRLFAGWIDSQPDERIGCYMADQMDIL